MIIAPSSARHFSTNIGYGDGPGRPTRSRCPGVPQRRMYGEPGAGRRLMDLEYYCLAVLTSHGREPEFVGAAGPAIPGHMLEGSGRGGHRREHLMAGQQAER